MSEFQPALPQHAFYDCGKCNNYWIGALKTKEPRCPVCSSTKANELIHLAQDELTPLRSALKQAGKDVEERRKVYLNHTTAYAEDGEDADAEDIMVVKDQLAGFAPHPVDPNNPTTEPEKETPKPDEKNPIQEKTEEAIEHAKTTIFQKIDQLVNKAKLELAFQFDRLLALLAKLFK